MRVRWGVSGLVVPVLFGLTESPPLPIPCRRMLGKEMLVPPGTGVEVGLTVGEGAVLGLGVEVGVGFVVGVGEEDVPVVNGEYAYAATQST